MLICPMKMILKILGLEMDFELDIDSDAEIAIVIDNESGSFLKGKGAGNILMEINTKGKLIFGVT